MFFTLQVIEFNVLVGDCYTKSHATLKKLLDNGRSLGRPNGILINGKNAKGDGKGEVVYTMKAGKTYKYRFCNVGIMNSINVKFQNHPLKLVEMEGSHTVQNKYDSLDILPGPTHKAHTKTEAFTSTRPSSYMVLLVNIVSRNEGKLRFALNEVSHVDPETPLKLAEYYEVGDKVFKYNLMSDEPPSNLKNLNIKDHK
ncbi:L-ascorbate oxidase-like protein [Senna tora]|uniref:L-ascorbate oxidase-like protein n=1 Tax=Senna tora TaxID=362788 RepID=A0A834T4D3_9FABA|nr:L-ascorbate oxidase-like protein [Senna tora]